MYRLKLHEAAQREQGKIGALTSHSRETLLNTKIISRDFRKLHVSAEAKVNPRIKATLDLDNEGRGKL